MLELCSAGRVFGFDTLHIPEMVHDPFVMLALAATSSLHVRTGVALALVRSPMVSALSAGSCTVI